MKGLLKQPLLWIGVIFLFLSMALAVGHSVIAPGDELFDKLESAMNKRDTKKLMECFIPEEQSVIQAEMELTGTQLFWDEVMAGTDSVRMLPIRTIAEDEESRTVQVFFVQIHNNVPYSVELDEVDILKIDGQEYFAYY